MHLFYSQLHHFRKHLMNINLEEKFIRKITRKFLKELPDNFRQNRKVWKVFMSNSYLVSIFSPNFPIQFSIGKMVKFYGAFLDPKSVFYLLYRSVPWGFLIIYWFSDKINTFKVFSKSHYYVSQNSTR